MFTTTQHTWGLAAAAASRVRPASPVSANATAPVSVPFASPAYATATACMPWSATTTGFLFEGGIRLIGHKPGTQRLEERAT